MPLKIVRNDITKMRVDAIVNAANPTLLGGGGVDGAIHWAAGKHLLEECSTLGGCPVGSAKLTGAYNLPCKYVIHAVGPIWEGGNSGERDLLLSCYRTSLNLAQQKGCQSIAFPLISSGAYGYPKDQALQVAIDAISSFLIEHDMTIYLVIYDKASFRISEHLFTDIVEFIDDNYVAEKSALYGRQIFNTTVINRRKNKYDSKAISGAPDRDSSEISKETPIGDTKVCLESVNYAPRDINFNESLNHAVSMIDESFSEMLLRKIKERGITETQCYKKANIDRKLFSKIRSDKFYKPSKETVLAFAIALELPLRETEEMLMKAGFALSHSKKFDIIVEYFIMHGNYNIFEINEALFAFDQGLLGA